MINSASAPESVPKPACECFDGEAYASAHLVATLTLILLLSSAMTSIAWVLLMFPLATA
jgi:hypothetical protein